MATEAKPLVDGDGVPWCDAACPHYQMGVNNSCGWPCVTAGTMLCPVAVRAVVLGGRFPFVAFPRQRCVELARELAEIRAELAAAKALARLPENLCLACGGDGGHHEGCPGTSGLMALSAELAEIRAAAGEESSLDLIAAAKRLRLTRDGVRMVPGGHYWGWCRVYEQPWELCEVVWWQGDGDDFYNPPFTMPATEKRSMEWEQFDIRDEDVWSTRAEAAKAKEAKR